jgi:hypothetical protein
MQRRNQGIVSARLSRLTRSPPSLARTSKANLSTWKDNGNALGTGIAETVIRSQLICSYPNLLTGWKKRSNETVYRRLRFPDGYYRSSPPDSGCSLRGRSAERYMN